MKKLWNLLLFILLLSPLSQAQYVDYTFPNDLENGSCLRTNTTGNYEMKMLLGQMTSLSLFPKLIPPGITSDYRDHIRRNAYDGMMSLHEQQKYNLAIVYADRVIQHSLLTKDTASMFSAYLCKAEASLLEERYNDALWNYNKAISLTTVVESKVTCYSQMAKLFTQKKDYCKAKAYLDLADSINDNPKVKASLLLIRADLYSGLQQFDKAEKLYDSSLRMDYGGEQQINILYQKMIFQTITKQHKEALKNFKQLLSCLPTSKISKEKEVQIYLAGGSVYANEHLVKEALHYWELAKNRIQYLNLDGRRTLLDRLSHAYAKTGDYKKAFDQHVSMHQLEKEFKSATILSGITDLETKYQTTTKDRIIVRERLATIVAQQRHYKQGVWIAVISILLFLFLLLRYVRYYYRKHREGKLMVIQNIGNLKELMAGDEKERDRMAVDLQEGINSSLAATYSYLHTIEQLYPVVAADLHFSKVKELLLDTSNEIRSIAFNLTPRILLKDGLELAIQDFCKPIFPLSITIEVQSYGKEPAHGDQNSLFLYQIAQQYLLHISKHLTFTELIIIIGFQKTSISLTIEDNGYSIVDTTDGKAGTALLSVREKVEKGKGRMSIDRRSGKGNVLHIDLPLQISS